MSDVIREYGEVVRYPVLVAEAHDDRQTHAGGWVLVGGSVRGCWPRYYSRTVHSLRDILREKKFRIQYNISCKLPVIQNLCMETK